MDSAIANVFDQAKADTMVLFQDGMRAVTSEKEVALDSVRLLEEEKLEIETRLLAMENELHDSKMKLDVLNRINAGLQQCDCIVERVIASSQTASMLHACTRTNTSHNQYNQFLPITRRTSSAHIGPTKRR